MDSFTIEKIYKQKEHYAMLMDEAVDDESYAMAHACWMVVCDILTILGDW